MTPETPQDARKEQTIACGDVVVRVDMDAPESLKRTLMAYVVREQAKPKPVNYWKTHEPWNMQTDRCLTCGNGGAEIHLYRLTCGRTDSEGRR